MTSIPPILAERGEIFVPVERGRKGPTVPRDEEHLCAADDDLLEAYLEIGHGYAVACRGDLAVIDADEPDALEPVLEGLPDTVWQVSGSRSSEHYFLEVPGLENDIPLDDPRTGENVGHVKAAPQSIVIGPGSRHESGNHYGPLHDVSAGIATITEADLRALIGPYTRDDLRVAVRDAVTVALAHAAATPVEPIRAIGEVVVEPFLENVGPINPVDAGDGSDVERAPVDLGIYDIDGITRSKYPEGKRTAHPFHGSSTGENFMVRDDGETWACWRNCGNVNTGVTSGHAGYLLGMEVGVIDCGDWCSGGLSSETWREIYDEARFQGYDIPTPTESIKQSPDIARCPSCEWALGDQHRDPFDDSVFECGRCNRRVTEDEAFAHADG